MTYVLVVATSLRRRSLGTVYVGWETGGGKVLSGVSAYGNLLGKERLQMEGAFGEWKECSSIEKVGVMEQGEQKNKVLWKDVLVSRMVEIHHYGQIAFVSPQQKAAHLPNRTRAFQDRPLTTAKGKRGRNLSVKPVLERLVRFSYFPRAAQFENCICQLVER